MNDRKPKLSKHKPSGQFFVKYKGRFHYLGKDEKSARVLYHQHIIQWAQWRQEREHQLSTRGGPRHFTFKAMTDIFLESCRGQCAEKTVKHYRSSLRRFLGVYGRSPVSMFEGKDLQAFKTELLGMDLARKTINHEIAAIKGMIQFGINLGYCQPINLAGVKPLRLDPPNPKGYTIHQMRRVFCSVDTRIKPWVAINWLTMARPTEVVRVCNRMGEWEEDGIFRLRDSKTGKSSGQARRLVFSALALKWFKHCEPWFQQADSYYHAIFDGGWKDGGAHPLRHGAATHLQDQGVPRAEIDLLLGHMPPRVSLTYAPIRWQPLRASIGRLTL